MPTFTYEALNSTGQSVKADVEAQNSDEAISKIRSQGYFPMKIREKAARKGKGPGGDGQAGPAVAPAKKKKVGEISINIGRIKSKVLVQFTRQFSTLQDAGLPILRSIKILQQQQKPGMMRNTLEAIAADVEGGSTLSEAMARHPKVFDKLYTNMVQAGETGGVLDVILQRLAEFMEKAQRLKRRIKGAMVYPAVVITVATLMVTGIMYFVIPKFQKLFADFKAGLPKITEDLMAISHWVAHQYGWAYILCSPIAIMLFIKLIGKTKPGRLTLDVIKLHVPIMRKIVSKGTIARFCRTLGTLLAAGVPILEAINITRDTCGNMIYARALQKVHDAIRQGEPFAPPLRNARVCDGIVVNMIDVGEETGEMDKMLMKIADNYDEEVDVMVGSMMSILEPVMIVVLGVIVGFIVLAVFLPYVKLLQTVSAGSGLSNAGATP